MQTQSIDRSQIWRVIAASSVGTVIEWYDFYIFGSLAMIIAPLCYPSVNDSLALIAYLSTFAVGFIVRPFGALFFGRIGDRVGRKYAFRVTLVVTLVVMGAAPVVTPLWRLHGSANQSSPSCIKGAEKLERFQFRRPRSCLDRLKTFLCSLSSYLE